MQVRTKINVDYNSGVNGTVSGIVYGTIDSASWLNDFEQLGVNYTYSDANENAFYKAPFVIDGAEIQAFYDAIESSIPTGLDYNEQQKTTYYLAMVIQMAQTFGIATTDIEIVA